MPAIGNETCYFQFTRLYVSVLEFVRFLHLFVFHSSWLAFDSLELARLLDFCNLMWSGGRGGEMKKRGKKRGENPDYMWTFPFRCQKKNRHRQQMPAMADDSEDRVLCCLLSIGRERERETLFFFFILLVQSTRPALSTFRAGKKKKGKNPWPAHTVKTPHPQVSRINLFHVSHTHTRTQTTRSTWNNRSAVWVGWIRLVKKERKRATAQRSINNNDNNINNKNKRHRRRRRSVFLLARPALSKFIRRLDPENVVNVSGVGLSISLMKTPTPSDRSTARSAYPPPFLPLPHSSSPSSSPSSSSSSSSCPSSSSSVCFYKEECDWDSAPDPSTPPSASDTDGQAPQKKKSLGFYLLCIFL